MGGVYLAKSYDDFSKMVEFQGATRSRGHTVI